MRMHDDVDRLQRKGRWVVLGETAERGRVVRQTVCISNLKAFDNGRFSYC